MRLISRLHRTPPWHMNPCTTSTCAWLCISITLKYRAESSLHDIVYFIYQVLHWCFSVIIRFTHHLPDSSPFASVIIRSIHHLLYSLFVSLIICFILHSGYRRITKAHRSPPLQKPSGLHFLRLNKQLNHISPSPAIRPQRDNLKFWLLHIRLVFIRVCVTFDLRAIIRIIHHLCHCKIRLILTHSNLCRIWKTPSYESPV